MASIVNDKAVVDGGADEMEEKVDEIWSQRVMEAYLDAACEYKHRIATQGLAIWQQTIESAPGMRAAPIATGSVDTKPFIIRSSMEPLSDENINMTKTKKFSILNSYTKKMPTIQRINSTMLEDANAIPSMQYWTQVERNIYADDEFTLSHLPYIDDEDDDEQFIADLLHTYSGGIHGAKSGCGEFINDFLLYETMQRLLVQHGEQQDDDIAMITQTLAHHFPNKLSAKQLRIVWPDLLERYGDVSPMNGDDSTVGITTNSCMSLFCRRCYIYDCHLHGVLDEPTAKSRRRINSPPCSIDCYRDDRLSSHALDSNRQSSGGGQSPSQSMSLFPKSRSFLSLPHAVKLESWSRNEVAIFNMLRRTYCDDFCRVARILADVCPENAKDCRQVQAFARHCDPCSPGVDLPTTPTKKFTSVTNRHHRFRLASWNGMADRGLLKNENVYHPCQHAGTACVSTNADCSCVPIDNLCTKFCRCPDSCKFRFPGCQCETGGCRTNRCHCYFANWECDPDTCKSCGCDNETESAQITCQNTNIQRGLQKLFMAPSDVSGWGCFAIGDIAMHEFVSEYCGEVITHDEAERRGHIYDKQMHSYLFSLNADYVVDATRKGNVIRFANHATRPNCYGKTKIVLGEHRIGIYAKREIAAGEELCFNYSYKETQRSKLVPIERDEKSGHSKKYKRKKRSATTDVCE